MGSPSMTPITISEPDIIRILGGPSAVGRAIDTEPSLISTWATRGIPARRKADIWQLLREKAPGLADFIGMERFYGIPDLT